MVCRINQLPSDIICYIFGLLNVGDACRARLSSSGWLRLPDSRSVLHFDSLNVLGKEIQHKDNPALQSKFVNTINRFLQVWMGERMHKLVVRFALGNEHASHIDRWIATSARMEVEEIELNFVGISQERYVFPSHAIHFEKAPYLKQLRLNWCTLSIPSTRTSWSSNLTTLYFGNVALDQQGIDFILSATSNLISLSLSYCNLPKLLRIAGQHIRLKNLSIFDTTLFIITLKCPNLEAFEYFGDISTITFSHVPVLKEAKLWPILAPNLFLRLLSSLTKHTPTLEVMTLFIGTEVKPLTRTLPCLKQLKIYVTFGFDLLSITRLLSASPLLETLHIKLERYADNRRAKEVKRKYRRRPHFHLKEIKIEGFNGEWSEMELATYLLESSMVLERIVIQTNGWSRLRRMVRLERMARLQLLKQPKISPTAQVIIL